MASPTVLLALVAALLLLGVGSSSAASAVHGHGPPPPPPPIAFNASVESGMVLQRAPAMAAVYGVLWRNESAPMPAPVVSVVVTIDGRAISLKANVSGANSSQWLARIPAQPAGGNVSVAARCVSGCRNTTYVAELHNITFGDLFYCSGQSNMWLPLEHTYSRNLSLAAIRAGKYSGLRIRTPMGTPHSSDKVHLWQTVHQAGVETDPYGAFGLFGFPATCYYFGEALIDGLRDAGAAVPPIGLLSTAIGGTRIEQWVSNATIAECRNVSIGAANAGLYHDWVVPYSHQPVAGVLWYQGENDMHGLKGDAADGLGYGCLQPKLVSSWRALWAANAPSTAQPLPFGVVTLAPGGSEGGQNMPTMRWAQTANYGLLPNPLMPATFLAQAYDLGDPWANAQCGKYLCCPRSAAFNETVCKQRGGTVELCAPQCNVGLNTSYYMGPIHPRVKKPVGWRLSRGMLASAHYQQPVAHIGPTISGCALDAAAARLTLSFNTTLLGGDTLLVNNYSRPMTASALTVLLNASFYCVEPLLRCQLFPNGTRPDTCRSALQEWYCSDGHSPDARPAPACTLPSHSVEGTPPRNPFEKAWISLNVSLAGPSQVTVDLSPLNGSTPVAVRYAWAKSWPCCQGVANWWEPCLIGSCPIWGAKMNLPANPFTARITGGKCVCPAPQQC